MAHRILPVRTVGSIDRRAPHWRGDDADGVLAARRSQYAQLERERAARRRRPSTRTTSRSLPTPTRTLARLRRALTRRKTLAARQRVAARIRALERELGIRA